MAVTVVTGLERPGRYDPDTFEGCRTSRFVVGLQRWGRIKDNFMKVAVIDDSSRVSKSFSAPLKYSRVRGAIFGAMCVVLVATLSACQSTGGRGINLNSYGENTSAKMNMAQKTLLGAGREAESINNYNVAANAYGRLFERRHNDVSVLTAFIRNMRYSGRAMEITNYVEKNTQSLIDDPHVKFEYAKALLAAGRKRDALVSLQEVAVVMEKNWQVYSAIGIANDSMGQFPQAIKAYAHALSLSPDNVVVMNNLAMSQAMSGQLAMAISTLEKAAGLNRKNTHIRQNLALLYAVNGEVDKAQTLAAMDLNREDLETNLSFYRRFGAKGQ